VFLLLLTPYRSLALMMQILNKVFRHEFVEKGGRPPFWNKIGKAPISLGIRNKGNRDSSILCENRKEIATVPSLKKVACPLFPALFSPVLPCAYRLLDLTKTRG